MQICSQNRDVDFSSPLVERTLSTHSLTHCSLVAATWGPAAHRWALYTRGKGVQLTCSPSPRPTSAHTPSMEHNLATTSRRPCPLPPPPSARTKAPTPRGVLQRYRAGRAANLMAPWPRPKGVPPKHISLARHTRPAQAGSTNPSMPTALPRPACGQAPPAGRFGPTQGG